MHWLIELSGEHPTLPKAEALAVLDSLGSPAEDVRHEGMMLTFTADAKPELVGERLAFSHYVNEELAAGSFDDIMAVAEGIKLRGARFMVRAPAGGGGKSRQSIEKEVGRVLAQTGKVDLRRPQETFRVLEGRVWHFCRVLYKINRPAFERRKSTKRPFNKPVSLHPRLARALVNLSRVKYGGTLLDPFCGTGGVVLEAALAGADVIGSDIDAGMVAGSRDSLKHFNQRARLIAADIGELPGLVESVDAIATDPPYGRSSSTKKEPVQSLYLRSFEVFHKILKPGGRAALCLPDMKYADMAVSGLELEEAHSVKVHASLTRHFLVFIKKS